MATLRLAAALSEYSDGADDVRAEPRLECDVDTGTDDEEALGLSEALDRKAADERRRTLLLA